MERDAIVTMGMRELFASLDERWRPERVAQQVKALLPHAGRKGSVIDRVAKAARRNTYMSEDFRRVDTMQRQIGVANELFTASYSGRPDDAESILMFLVEAGHEISWDGDRPDFKHDRLNREARREIGLDISRRQYNKRFRLLGRMLSKLSRMEREQLKRSLTLASKSRLGSKIEEDDFMSDLNTACFVAYYVARANVRSLFTNAKQVRPFDAVCQYLLKRCEASETTNWYAIAHAYPEPSVIARLTDEQKGKLLGVAYTMMADAAGLLREVWGGGSGIDAKEMIVRRGNDSSTWNITAGAWNKIREEWLSLLHSMGMEEILDEMCPGKVMRLMAADVAHWHRISGGTVHPDTLVWAELPRPWDVLSGDAHCGRQMVIDKCVEHGVDWKRSGWVLYAPPKDVVAKFTPTPELVHGVVVSSPRLAASLRRLGVFSGKHVRMRSGEDLVDIARGVRDRDRHWDRQGRRRAAV